MDRSRKRPPPKPAPIAQRKAQKTETADTLIADQLKCPVCLQLMEDPFISVCGHNFCWCCIKTSLEFKPECPSCKHKLSTAFPDRPGMSDLKRNHELAARAQRFKSALEQQRALLLNVPPSALVGEAAARAVASPELDLATVSRMIRLLEARKRRLLQDQAASEHILVSEFLEQMIERREVDAARLGRELAVLKADRASLGHISVAADADITSEGQGQLVPQRGPALHLPDATTSADPDIAIDVGTRPAPTSSELSVEELVRDRRVRLGQHFGDLESAYLQLRAPETAGVHGEGGELREFSGVLARMTQFRGVRRLAGLSYAGDGQGGLSIVSSIEFNKGGSTVAVAGVTRKIKLYDYAAVLESAVDLHYPTAEMRSDSKISSVSWNQFTRSQLASSDYDGTILIWDANTAEVAQRFSEHEKRCWSVDFSSESPRLLASGSDDGAVKLWQTGVARSVSQISVDVNVCCVQFSRRAGQGHLLAFGSADHCVHLYDIRAARGPLGVLKGHRKAVSYVKFLESGELVSASTDSELRVWDVDARRCRQVLKGHQNEKNFVGLATGGDFVACGSENNQLYIYYKLLSRPLLRTTFGGDAGFASLLHTRESGSVGEEAADVGGAEPSDFVSAIAWKQDSNVIVAANSQGLIRVMELV